MHPNPPDFDAPAPDETHIDGKPQAADRPPDLFRHRRLIAWAAEQARPPSDARARSHSSDLRGGIRRPGQTDGSLDLPGYDLVREIHRGAQGVVYEALQRSTRRTVAIKVIRFGPLASAAERARFEREVQLLAQLRHPNIVAIHDSGRVGTHDYFVMDYIEGAPLDQHVAHGAVSLRDRMRLMARICHAVNVAHLRGVIHRDLKPGNIRVDHAGEPHVLDFGLAKELRASEDESGAAGMTQAGQFVGSLPWASPEQAEGRLDDIDLRTDVYALGVMLYQVLTGEFPYAISRSLRETTHNIVHQPPTDPRERNSSIEADLATIVLKCLRKPRDERYQTAGELARDLERYLAGEPIEARRDSALYLLRKNLARYRLAVGVAAVFLVVVTIGLGVALQLRWKADAAHRAEQAQRQRATQQWQQAEQARAEEEKQRRRAELEAAKSRAMSDFLIDVMGSADPERGLGPKSTVLELMEAAVAKLDRGALKDQPLVHAAARGTLGRTLMRLGLHDRAAVQFDQALALRRANGATPREISTSVTDLGLLAGQQGRYDVAEARARESLAIVEADPEREDKDLASSLGNLALVLQTRGNFVAAADMLRRALELDRRILKPDDPDLAVSLNNLALALRSARQLDEAEKHWLEALELLRRIHGEDNLRVAAVLESLGGLCMDRGDLAGAEARQREANACRERAVGGEHPHVAQGLSNLGHILFLRGQYDAADAALARSLELKRKLLGGDHPSVATTLNLLGLIRDARQDFAGAEKLYREALPIRRAKLGDDHPLTMLQESNLACSIRKAGRAAEALEIINLVVERAGNALPADSPYQPEFRAEWGACLAELRRFEEAERVLLAAHASAIEVGDRRLAGRIREKLADMYESKGDPAEAGKWRKPVEVDATTRPSQPSSAP